MGRAYSLYYGINVFVQDGKEINFVDGLVEKEKEKDNVSSTEK